MPNLAADLPKQVAEKVVKPIGVEIAETGKDAIGQLTGLEIDKKKPTDEKGNRAFVGEIYKPERNLSPEQLSQLSQHESSNTPASIEEIRSKLAEAGGKPQPTKQEGKKPDVMSQVTSAVFGIGEREPEVQKPRFASAQHRDAFLEVQSMGEQMTANIRARQQQEAQQNAMIDENKIREAKENQMSGPGEPLFSSIKRAGAKPVKMQTRILNKVKTRTESGKMNE